MAKKDDEMAPAFVSMASDPDQLETAGEAKLKAEMEQRDDHEQAWAEREAAGFAPRLIPGDTRSREEREAATREALKRVRAPAAPIPTPEEALRRQMELRAPPGAVSAAPRTASITVNDVTYRYTLGEEDRLPEGVRELVMHERSTMSTLQMQSGEQGRIVDYTKK